ncbi:hypothetical protein QZH41_002907 [Actinostola sp. cb2023]|nr:hypothetical protein QZH41_002907 [Actinostola sp. cb2023]
MTTSTDLTKKPIWAKRMGSYFDSLNLNHDKYLTIDEILTWADNMEKACKATPQEMKALRQGLQDFWGIVGLVPGAQLTKEQFLHGVNRLGQLELKRKAENKPTMHEKLNNAFFDVTDINNDGTVTLEELRIMMKACNMDPSGAEAWFQAADVNKNGRIERGELNKSEFDFWFRPDDPSSGGVFGGTYE